MGGLGRSKKATPVIQAAEVITPAVAKTADATEDMELAQDEATRKRRRGIRSTYNNSLLNSSSTGSAQGEQGSKTLG